MKEIQVNNNIYLFIEVPNDATNFHVLSPNKENWDGNYLVGKPDTYKLIDRVYKNNWKIISTSKDITEEQDGSIVYHHVVNEAKYYSNYLPFNGQDFRDIIDNSFKTAKESLQLLIQANGMDVNKNYLILLKK